MNVFALCDSESETYLSKYVTETTAIDNIDIYQVMLAAQVELLGLTVRTKCEKPANRGY
jgi:hypothetical protein